MTALSETKPNISEKIVKHSLTVAGHRTSISLEFAFWDEFKGIANTRGQAIDAKRAAPISPRRSGSLY
jgi:predicted DNA-binding ribbon-helix-helix protein